MQYFPCSLIIFILSLPILSLVSCKQTQMPLQKNLAQSQSGQDPNSAAATPDPNKRWCLRLKVPDGNWQLLLDTIYQQQNNLYVFAQLLRKSGSGIQVIREAVACAPIDGRNSNIHIYIKGKTWGWENHSVAKFVTKWPTPPKGSQLIYRYNKKDKPIKPGPADSLDQ